MLKKYQVIYADPPWKYDNVRTGSTLISGAAQKYEVLTIKQICNLPISKLKTDNSILFLWITVPFLFDGKEIMDCWGFKYKTMIVWKKTNFGMGFWFRGQVECLLLGISGKVKPFRCQRTNIIENRTLAHSEKPQIFRELIEDITRDYHDKIELFARKKHKNWDVWGNEVKSDINLEDYC